ncbi:methyltransferase [Chelatococcus sp. SYSU_G07232]|uniref:Methyltransferase n=1 Tax=Chelatococcus albus TaxID=3047466 RepID=A0ABT7AEL7_9HYPH|nr:methyltransferase [Chelatococcus sp. SYSU_G07232]MDJ1157813.1 methyltransferase [Chelatococcus sp. SYSU_G07232]
MTEAFGATHSVDIVEDRLVGGRLVLRQPRRGHRAGTDAVLLAAAAGPVAGATVVDLGAGVGTVGLAVALRVPDARIVLVERDAAMAALARENAVLNDVETRTQVIQADILARGSARRAAGLMAEVADVVLTNPPFFEAGKARRSPDERRRAAHVMDGTGLDGWLRAAADLLKPGGRLVLIHRADALAGLLAGLAGRFGAVAIKPVHARVDAPAIRVLVAGIRGSRAGISLLPPLILHGADGRFTPEAEAIHRGEALIGLP